MHNFILFLKNLNINTLKIIGMLIINEIKCLRFIFKRDTQYYVLKNEKINSASWLIHTVNTTNSSYPVYYNRTSLLKHSLKFAVTDNNIPGLFLEFGVCTGRTLNYMSSLYPDQKFYGFDSFEGLPENWRPGYNEGAFKIRKPVVNSNVELIQGLFEDTLPNFIIQAKSNIAFLHIDSDLYSSCKTIFEYCTPKINKGTIIVFDEFFGYIGWQLNEYKAFQEWVTKFNVSFSVIGYGKEQLSIKIESITTNS